MGRPCTPARAIVIFAAGTAVFAAQAAARTAAADAPAPPPEAPHCPDEAAVWSSATAIVPSAAGVLLAARPRVTIADLGDRYLVRVVTDHGPLERTGVDPARECDKRARFVAEFIVLALLPPAAAIEETPPAPSRAPDAEPPSPASPPVPSVSAPPPAQPTSAAAPNRAKPATTPPVFRVELGLATGLAPAVLGAFPAADWGGEARVRLGAGRWAATASATVLPKVAFTARGDRAGLSRVPLEAGVRAHMGTAWATFAADAALALAYEQYTGESTHAPQSASRWAPGVAVGAIASTPPVAGFAPYLRVSCALFPFVQSIVFAPETNPPNTPSLWFGASVGIAYER
ncbi:MAG TPA: hypothetical protein VK841_18310 [Polyangiaceae bacterium]|nr:hypothetical protein [Polyangiaceae bacterium]